ncbi:hypothetical protein VNO77_02975 [Canavalia gladiata]|uniref:Uncharacterized protein n=1 Tax=Canavalia gladiata TaxID=3824 RepID=A0AAN9MZJ5_CANGL
MMRRNFNQHLIPNHGSHALVFPVAAQAFKRSDNCILRGYHGSYFRGLFMLCYGARRSCHALFLINTLNSLHDEWLITYFNSIKGAKLLLSRISFLEYPKQNFIIAWSVVIWLGEGRLFIPSSSPNGSRFDSSIAV